MNTRFYTACYVVLFVLLSVAVLGLSFSPAPVSKAAPAFPAFVSRVQPDVNMMVRTWRPDRPIVDGGPVSTTCIKRNLFEYHNIDGYECGNGIVAMITKAVHDIVLTATATPTSSIPTATSTATDVPEATGTPETTPTTVVTEEPKATSTPAPEPTKECKNKNSGKDGTPAECNAGIGQEKNNPTPTPAPTQSSLILFTLWGYRLITKGVSRRIKLFNMCYSNAAELVAVCKGFGIDCTDAMPAVDWDRIYSK